MTDDNLYAPENLEPCCEGAQVRRITERDHVVWNRVEVSPGAIATRVWYECAKCGRRLEER